MTPERLRAALRFGVLALLLLAPLPFGSVQAGPVLAIELTAAALGLITILLIARDEDASAAIPKAPLAICLGVIALGIFQLVPVPFSIAEKFNPTADLVRPLIPYLGGDHPPPVSWSVASPETTDALLRFIAYLLIGLAAAVAFDTERSRHRFALVLVAAAVFQAVYGSGEYLTGRQHIFGFAKKYYLDSATGTFINRNHFATLLAIALPFALSMAIPRSGDRRRAGWRERLVGVSEGPALRRLFAAVAAALIWMGLLLSHSRAGLLAALAGAAIVLFHFRAMRAARWTAAAGSVIVFGVLSLQLAVVPGARFLELKKDLQSKGGRLTVWRDTLDLVKDRPLLGWGLGTFASTFPTVQSAEVVQLYDHAHNDWLEWAVEGGLALFCAAVALFAIAFWAGDAGCRAAILSVAVHSMWDFSLRIPAISLASAALIGLAIAKDGRAPAFRRKSRAVESLPTLGVSAPTLDRERYSL